MRRKIPDSNIQKWLESKNEITNSWKTQPAQRKVHKEANNKRLLKCAWMIYVRKDAFTGVHLAAEWASND